MGVKERDAGRRQVHTHTHRGTERRAGGARDGTTRAEGQRRPAKLREAEREPPLQRTKGLGFPTTWGPRMVEG